MAGDWTDTTLGDLLTLQRGFDLPDTEREPGPYLVVASTGPVGTHAAAMVRGPGVVIGRSGSLGGGQFLAQDFWPLNTTLWVKDFKGNDPRFCYYLLRSLDLARFNAGSGVPTLNRNHIHPLPVSAPKDPGEQRAIAHILGTLDDKVELNRRMNETLEAMGRALFTSWFVDFDPVRAQTEGRNAELPQHLAQLFPRSFEESQLGEVPEGWAVTVLEDVLTELETGGRPKGGVSGYATGIPSIGAESIVGFGVFDYSKTKYVPQAFFDGMPKGHVRSRDVLLYKDGGRPGQFEPHMTLFGDGFPFDTCAINEHVYRMRAKEEVGQNFLFFWLSSDLVMEEMRTKGTGVAIPGLNSTQVKSLTTLLPPSAVVRAFDKVVEPWVTRVLASCSQSRTLAELRDTLLPKLISGELRVPAVEPMVAERL
ncbi:MAG: restriction endonuclease subunit S [bacterium]